MKKHWLLLPIAASHCLMPLVACGKTDTFPYDQLLSSYQKMLCETIITSDYEGKTAKDIIDQELDIEHEKKFQEEFDAYFFKNINYDDKDPALWATHQHIVRTLQIAILAYKNNDSALMDVANKLTGFWLCHDFKNSNWWFNQIGVPRDFSNLAIFVINNLPSDQQQCMMEWIRHGSLKYNPETLDETGTNMFWAGDITLKAGLLAKDYSEIELMFEKVGNEIQLDKDEGFQSDGSYFQHGHQLYTGGYGRQGALLLARIASAFVNSDIELDQNKLKIIMSFVLDGVKYFTHKKNFNWQCMGRTFVRKQATQFNGGTTDLGDISELRYFAQLPNCPRKEELLELLNHWEKGEASFDGIKYFERSRFLASCIDGIYIGFKGTKGDLINCEIANNENILSHNLTFGVNTCVMQDGDEYADISPLWNYSDMPGTSTYPETDTELEKYDNESFKHTKTGFFYADTIDNNQKTEYACVSQSTWHEHIWPSVTQYRITGFATPYGLAVLGNNVSNTHHLLTTTVQQCLKGNKEVTISDNEKQVTHGNVVYTNIEDAEDSKLTQVVETRGGEQWSWHRNNRSYDKTDVPNDAQVLTIKINNSNNQQYAYAIQPKKEVEDFGTFKVAHNDENAQAILLPNGKILCMFLNDYEFEYESIKCKGVKGQVDIFPK